MPIILQFSFLVSTPLSFLIFKKNRKEREGEHYKKRYAGPEELFLDTASTPDLYGPIWVSLTIVFLLTAVAQFNNTGKGEINRKEVGISVYLRYCSNCDGNLAVCATLVLR